jgi:hypothetical protein
VRLYGGGWADYVRRREEVAATAEQVASARRKPRRERPRREPARRPERDLVAEIEGRIEAQEAAVARLEARLAEDWADVDAIAAHRRAREELQTLLGEWEELMEAARRP